MPANLYFSGTSQSASVSLPRCWLSALVSGYQPSFLTISNVQKTRFAVEFKPQVAVSAISFHQTNVENRTPDLAAT